VRNHTTLRAWQEAHAISVEVIRLSKTSWKPYAAALFSQLQRASLSVQLNLAEGYTFGVLSEGSLHGLLQRIEETERLLLGMFKRRRKFTS
jgi:hypothetical protein